MHIRQGRGDALDVFFTAFRVAAVVLLEEHIHNDQLSDFGGHTAELEGPFIGAAAQNDICQLRRRGFGKPGYQNGFDAPLLCQLQHLQAVGSGAGIGEQQDDAAFLQGCRSSYCLSLNRWKFATYASRAIEFSNKAVQTDENNPLALSLKGNVEFYSPAMFGGSKKKALEYFQKAINAFEEKNLVNNNWNYVATMLCYAQAYDKQGEKKKAKEVCQKILSIAPTFTYVRDTYYPQLVK